MPRLSPIWISATLAAAWLLTAAKAGADPLPGRHSCLARFQLRKVPKSLFVAPRAWKLEPTLFSGPLDSRAHWRSQFATVSLHPVALAALQDAYEGQFGLARARLRRLQATGEPNGYPYVLLRLAILLGEIHGRLELEHCLQSEVRHLTEQHVSEPLLVTRIEEMRLANWALMKVGLRDLVEYGTIDFRQLKPLPLVVCSARSARGWLAASARIDEPLLQTERGMDHVKGVEQSVLSRNLIAAVLRVSGLADAPPWYNGADAILGGAVAPRPYRRGAWRTVQSELIVEAFDIRAKLRIIGRSDKRAEARDIDGQLELAFPYDPWIW